MRPTVSATGIGSGFPPRETARDITGVSKLVEQVERAICTRRLIRDNQPLLVAVSGGVDSMVLLELLHQLSKKYDWSLTVAHLNHGLRSNSSHADERLVLREAAKMSLPVIVDRADVRAAAKAHKLSLEMAARKERHAFLARAAERLEIKSIALAHHSDDQLELFFLRLLRGSGSEGLSGLKWRSSSPCNSRIDLVRPLLGQSKADVREYAAQAGVQFREDASNSFLHIQRNRIRHELLPLLEKYYQPSLRRTISRTLDILDAEAEFLRDIAADWLERRTRRAFDRLPLALQRKCIQLQLIQRGVVPGYDLVEQLRLVPERRIAVPLEETDDEEAKQKPTSALIRRDSSGILNLQQPHLRAFMDLGVQVRLKPQGGEIAFDGLAMAWRILTRRGTTRPSPASGQEWFDADKVGSRIFIRHWRQGDRFQPIGMGKAVKLQDLFVNYKVPREQRHHLVVATTRRNEPFWVEGLRISERFKLDKATNRRLHWMWRRV